MLIFPVLGYLPARITVRFALLLALVSLVVPLRAATLPKRLILLVDGVSHRDMQALQAGVTYTDLSGRQHHRQAFNEGYFPVSRNISTFPSASDVSWSEILGNRPVPGYQRTYFDTAKNATVYINGVTSSMEYENQMTWQLEGGFRRVLGYVAPLNTFKYEVSKLAQAFLNSTNGGDNFYALIHSTDSAQHLSGDIFAMLGALDQKLQELRATYREREGHELEILLVSDHGNNHSGLGKRVAIRGFLKKAGYHITKSLRKPGDIILPTAGVESWVEIHNSPAETERLMELLPQLAGVGIVTATIPDQPNQFAVANSAGERARITWNPANNTFQYSSIVGDPLGYRPVLALLSQKGLLDSAGFATSDAWMAATLEHQYPLALERIVRGHTRVTLNPATILISLNNDYVHCGWFIKRGIALVKSGGTHGSLDNLNSNGILLSSFAPTADTSTSRVAALFDGFKGRRNDPAPKPISIVAAKTPSANGSPLISAVPDAAPSGIVSVINPLPRVARP